MSTSTVRTEVAGNRNNALLVGLPLAGTYAVVVVAFLAVRSLSTRWLLGDIAVVASAALAAIASAVQTQRSTGDRLPWACLTTASLAAALCHLLWALGTTSILPIVLLFVSSLSFCAAVTFDFVRHSRVRSLDLALDVAVAVTSAIVIVQRWAPSASVFIGVVVGPFAGPMLLAFSAIVMLTALFFALTDVTAVAGSSAAALVGAAASISLATFPIAFQNGRCCVEGNPFALAAVSGWLFVSYAALRLPVPVHARSRASWNMRELMPPAAALLIGVVLFHSALQGPLPLGIAFVLATLLVFVAARMTQLLLAARRHREERAELTHSRALVQVSKSLSDTTDLEAILRVVIELCCQLLPVRGAGVELFDADGTTLALRAAGGVSGPIDLELLHGDDAVKVKLHHRGTVLGVLTCVADRRFAEDDTELLGALADQAAVAIENASLFHQVEVFSLTDPLTGLSNRRHLERDLSREFAAARRGRRLVAIMFDLNGFKDYNDKNGHVAGDEALRAFAETLRTETRAMNAAARYGGDEFFVLIGDSDLFGAQVFVVRVKQRFSRAIAALGRGQLSVAAGIGEYHHEMTCAEELIEAADRALYESKAVPR